MTDEYSSKSGSFTRHKSVTQIELLLVTNVLIFFIIKKALSVWKLVSTKHEDNKKLLHKKARPYRCGCGHDWYYSVWNETHMCGRCLGFFFFSNVLLLVHPRSELPHRAVTDPFLSFWRMPLILTCFYGHLLFFFYDFLNSNAVLQLVLWNFH